MGGGGGGGTSFRELVSELYTRTHVELFEDTSFTHSVSTHQIRLLQRGCGQNFYSHNLFNLKISRTTC